MKQFKRGILIFLCVLSSFSVLTGCGSNEEDNGAVKEDMQDNTMNDATDGTGEDGAAQDIGEDIKDEAENIGEDMRDGADDMKDEVEQDAEDARDDMEDSNDNADR